MVALIACPRCGTVRTADATPATAAKTGASLPTNCAACKKRGIKRDEWQAVDYRD